VTFKAQSAPRNWKAPFEKRQRVAADFMFARAKKVMIELVNEGDDRDVSTPQNNGLKGWHVTASSRVAAIESEDYSRCGYLICRREVGVQPQQIPLPLFKGAPPWTRAC